MGKSLYELLQDEGFTKEAKEDEIRGGVSDGHADSEYPKDQLKKGIKVEMEHTTSKAKAKEITKDHLQEEKEMSGKSKDELEYYDELEDMENSLKEAACGHDRRYPGRRPRKEPLNRPDLSDDGKNPIREGFRKKADEDLKELMSRFSPSMLRSILAGGAGAVVGGVLGAKGGHLAMSVPPTVGRAGELFSGMGPQQKRRVIDMLKELGRSRGAVVGATALGLTGAYIGSRPSLD